MNQSYIIVATLSMLIDEGRRILFMLTVRYTILRNKLCAHDKVTLITRVIVEAKSKEPIRCAIDITISITIASLSYK